MKWRKDLAGYAVLLGIFVYIWYLNHIIPLSFGDDYVYQYVWDGSTGWNMFHPLEDNAQLVQSWGDIFRSQWSHYFTWGGRTVAHTLAQWVLWQGKWLFDILNSFAFVLLLLLIYWHSLGGKVTGHLRPTRLLFIFLCVWAFVPALPTVLFWVLGACNYLWMLDILLVFLLPYVRHFFQRGTGGKWWQAAVMLPFGVIAGWTNENTVCWCIIGIADYAWHCYRQGRLPAWQLTGLLGMCIGYTMLILAPGNRVRLAAELQMGLTTGWYRLYGAMVNYGVWLIFSLLLLFFLFQAWERRCYFGTSGEADRRLPLVRGFFLIFAGSAGIMLLSPDFPQRSLFPSSIFLIIAATAMLELIRRSGRNRQELSLRRFLTGVATVYLCLTLSATGYGYAQLNVVHRQNEQTVMEAMASPDAKQVIEVAPVEVPRQLYLLSGMHVVATHLTPDEENWVNRSYAKRLGVYRIRTFCGKNVLE
ncbi:MAG: hypothetical protein II145_04865 [Selenomonas sp.]|nr:hypothetical protein [Selenomonas sp.]